MPAGADSTIAARPSRPEAPAERKVLATAVFVAGSGRLEPGGRYGLAIEADRLVVLGPTSVDPSIVVLARPVSGINASAIDGRLIISEPQGRSGMVLAFMSIAGTTPNRLEAMINEAAARWTP